LVKFNLCGRFSKRVHVTNQSRSLLMTYISCFTK